jgi:RNA polymerase sigma factor (sigma-70 family)
VIEENEGLIHAVMQGIRRGGVPYDELLQEGRIGLWQAVRCFDDARGVAFSTYAWVVVERRIWRAITLAKRPEGQPMGREPGEELEAVLLRVWQCQVSEALSQALKQLPEELAAVMVSSYGLQGQDRCTLAALGRQRGLSRERMRQVRNDGLVLLRLPALAGSLHRVCGLNTRQAQARMQGLNRDWLRRRRRR